MSKLFNDLTSDLRDDEQWEKLTTINNNWKKDAIFHKYHKLGNKQKGTLGEYFVERLMKKQGYNVTPPTDTDHDRIIDGLKVEIKTSLAVSETKTLKGKPPVSRIIKDKFIFNHIAVHKDWDRLLFCCVNPDPSWGNMHIRRGDKLPHERLRVYYMDKADFSNYMATTPVEERIFKYQQGGKKGGNDDYVCSDLHKLIELPFVRHIDEW